MLDLARYDGRNRIRGSIYLSVAMAVLAGFMVWIFPSYSEAFGEDEEILEALPEAMIRVFDVQTMASLEGFLAFELYVFGWIILLGLYVAYLGAGTIADDVERGRMDIVLAMPISRAQVALERFAGLAVPIVAVNVLTPIVVYVGGHLIDEPIAAVDLLAVHLLSIPYLFACGAIGLLASVIVDRTGIAQRAAIGVTFGLFLIESLLIDTDYEAFGAISPARYYDPNEILLESTYDLVNVAVLVAMIVVLLAASAIWFRRRDV
ncbi:ABC transporter permease [Natronobacterium texcoconense]|uniref:ABC-2 type transport system permease protein n=1 Tax=Natronobacterium texcoconense TaxID=1095778 RepID=A0A1H1H0S2_NATTX|nr:ABC transporter permease subunit [Natronobacterium texcoconense]SDR19037.1 ABC-2 type transport system permease protein [Natronobacterium texcoconense]